MSATQKPDQYLMERAGRWYYQRFIPARFQHVDSRKRIRTALRTKSVDIARLRRDALAEADDAYWLALSIEAAENGGVSDATLEAEQHRYEAAQARAMAYGFKYKPAEDLAKEARADKRVERLLERIEVLERQTGASGRPPRADTEALLGGVERPEKPVADVTSAFELYVSDIAFDEQKKKSPKQRRNWEKTKRTSINYFIDVIDDVPLNEITREMALAYRSWWIERMIPGDGDTKPASPNTANRHIGNMRSLYDAYFTHIGSEERLNPFRKMFFKDDQETKVPPFQDEWVRDKILVPGMFDELNDDLRLMIYVLIETGARISEICNLMPEQIRLDSNTPHIEIRAIDRELKTVTSKREIPLVGVALEAMRYAPNGFPHYRDRGELVSANLMKAFRHRNLFPTTDHVIYSFRHAFEDRMLEAGIDFGMRCYLMGHKNPRPDYGSKGSLEFRQELLMKIAHSYPMGLIKPSSAMVEPA